MKLDPDIARWFLDVSAEPPAREDLEKFFCRARGVRWYNRSGKLAVALVVTGLLEIREMLMREVERTREASARSRALVQVALDAETVSVVLKHRLALTEEVASAAEAGGGERLEKALARYRAVRDATS